MVIPLSGRESEAVENSALVPANISSSSVSPTEVRSVSGAWPNAVSRIIRSSPQSPWQLPNRHPLSHPDRKSRAQLVSRDRSAIAKTFLANEQTRQSYTGFQALTPSAIRPRTGKRGGSCAGVRCSSTANSCVLGCGPTAPAAMCPPRHRTDRWAGPCA